MSNARQETGGFHLVDRDAPRGDELRDTDTPTRRKAPELTQARFNNHDCGVVASAILVAQSVVHTPCRATVTHAFVGNG